MRIIQAAFLIGVLTLVASAPLPARVRVGDVIESRVETPHPVQGGSWRQEVTLPGATFLRLHALQMDLGNDDRFRVSDADGREVYVHEGPLAEPLWLPMVEGEKAVLEVWTAPGSRPWGLLVDKVLKGFAPLTAEGFPVAQSICGIDDSKDPDCYSSDTGKIQAGNAVGRMQFVEGGSGFLCTGFLVSSRAHFLTCNHCISTQDGAASLIVWWEYQTPSCGFGNPAYQSSTSGAQLLKTSADYDYSLLLLTTTVQNPADQYGYLALNSSANQVGDTIWIPQHPQGLAKKFAVVSDMDGGGAAKVQGVDVNGFSTQPPGTDIAYYADTAPGSSGSPVLSLQNQVVAIHHAGTGGPPCTPDLMNQGVEMRLIYPQIADYLADPKVSAVSTVGNPFRLRITGTHFQQGAVVFIGGAQVPQTAYKSATQLIAKKGSALKTMVPAGTPVEITVNNPDGGVSPPFTYTR